MSVEALASLQSSAPGKVILAGEYAVLDGAPCVVMAVDRRLKVRLSPGVSDHFCFQAAGLAVPDGRVNLHGTSWHEAAPFPAEFGLLKRLLDHWSKDPIYRSFLARGWQLTVDSSELFERANKLGLGSSAALTVAFYCALREAHGKTYSVSEDTWSACQSAHCVAQAKRGSGADVLAALSGGVSCFYPPDPQSGQVFHCQQHGLPDGMEIAFFWSGEHASTPAMLNALDRWRAEQPQLYQNHQGALREAIQALLEQTQASAYLSALATFTRRLFAFDHDAKLGVFAAGHQALWQASECMDDLIYKPCGAGGGDLGIALSASSSALRSFTALAQDRGFSRIAMSVDSRGPHVEISQ